MLILHLENTELLPSFSEKTYSSDRLKKKILANKPEMYKGGSFCFPLPHTPQVSYPVSSKAQNLQLYSLVLEG